MPSDTWKRKQILVPAIVVAVLVAYVVLRVDDWGRDFTSHEAEISADASDASLRPLESRRPLSEMVQAVRQAAKRIGNLDYVGEAADGDRVQLLFVRTSRILRLKKDVVITIRDVDGRRVVTGESRSRLGLPDLGSNPRTLRRILVELRDVLEGAYPVPGTVDNVRP
jgi:hypothetical protein